MDFAKKIDLSNLKLNVDKLDIVKVETTPVDLSKLSNVVKSDIVKKTTFNQLVKNVNAIQTTDTSDLVKQIDCNTKFNETEKKINGHDHDKYATVQEFSKSTLENLAARLPQANLARKNDITNFVKKTDFDDKAKNLNQKVTSNKKNMYLLKMN